MAGRGIAAGLALAAVLAPVPANSGAPAGDSAGDSAGEPDGAPPGPIVIDDDFADVGPAVAPAPADEAPADDPGAHRAQVEVRAEAFARAIVDVVHDPAPPAAEPGAPVAGEDVLAFRWHGRGEGVRRLGGRAKVKVAVRFDADAAFDADARASTERYEAHVWDTYVDLYSRWLDLRVGNQFIAWGTADLLSPNDVVDARDLRRGFLAHPEDVRWPVFAATAAVHRGAAEAQLVYLPVAPAHRFELVDGDYALLGPNAPTAVERRVGAIVAALADDPRFAPALQPIVAIGDPPDRGVGSGEVGGRLAVTTAAVDAYAFALWGHERSPRIDVAGDLRALFADAGDALTVDAVAARVQQLAERGDAAVTASYPRRWHLGAAVATRVDPIGVKVDVGYDPGATALLVSSPADGLLLATPRARDRIAGTVSIDYDRGEELSAVFELSHARVLGVPAGARVFQFDGAHQTVAATQLRWAPRGVPVRFELLAFAELRDEPGYAVRPAVELSGHDHIAVEVAALVYGGPPDTLAGTQARNDAVSLTVRYGW